MRRLSQASPLQPASALLLATAVMVTGCAPAPPGGGSPDGGPIAIAVTLPPQAWLAERIGGDRVRTTVLLPPGRSHHTFEPEPREILALRRARLYLTVDHPDLPFESVLLGALPQAPRPEIVSWSAAAEAASGEPPGPHFWLDPGAMTAAAEATAAALVRLDPDRTVEYHDNLIEVTREIEAVAGELEERLSPHRGGSVLVYHPAWGDLLARYGVSEEAIERDGKEPSPRQLAEQIGAARRRGVTTVFSQPGLPEHATRALAEEIGAEVVELDPLARDWASNLRRAGRALAVGAIPAATPGAAPGGTP